jgi:hypothetical protein
MRGLALLICLTGCFSPSYHNGAFLCSANGGRCPEGFHCAADQTCWRNGQDPVLPDGGADLLSDGSADMVRLPDLAEPLPDARPPDGGWVVSSGIVTLGNSGTNGPFRLSDDGLEFSDVACNGTFCVMGGMAP